jgi:hypothetical protein
MFAIDSRINLLWDTSAELGGQGFKIKGKQKLPTVAGPLYQIFLIVGNSLGSIATGWSLERVF